MPQEYKSLFKQGEHLFQQGDAGDCAFIIEKGEVEVYINKAGSKMIVVTQ